MLSDVDDAIVENPKLPFSYKQKICIVLSAILCCVLWENTYTISVLAGDHPKNPPFIPVLG